MNILDNLIEEARQQSSTCKDGLRIDNIIIGKTLYTMKDCDKVFTDMNFCLVLFENAYGFSYFQGEIDYSLSKFVNKNALSVLEEEMPIYFRVAIIDALYCLINRKILTNKLVFVGDIRQKARERARALLANITNGAKVLLLGAATEIIEEAKAKGCILKVLDLEKQKVGLKFHSAFIENSVKTDLADTIKKTDYIVATGMIFVTETADKVFELTNLYKKSLTLFMETGSNFGPQLLKYGADIVLSEFFPYYDFFGETKYLLFQKNNNPILKQISKRLLKFFKKL